MPAPEPPSISQLGSQLGSQPSFAPPFYARQGVDWFLFLLLFTGFLWLVARGAEHLGYNWQWYQVPRSLVTRGPDGLSSGPLLAGLGVTLKLTALAFAGAFTCGLAAALLRLSGSLAGRILARGYLEAVRNTPLLIQLFFLYFVLSPILGLDALATAVLGLSLFEGAYMSEILRAGIVSIDHGQWDAAQSLGMDRLAAYRHVILPQAARRILPPLASQTVSLVKDSSLVSAIAVGELTMRGQSIVAETFLSFEIWFTVAAMYWLITTSLSGLAAALERRLAYPT